MVFSVFLHQIHFHSIVYQNKIPADAFFLHDSIQKTWINLILLWPKMTQICHGPLAVLDFKLACDSRVHGAWCTTINRWITQLTFRKCYRINRDLNSLRSSLADLVHSVLLLLLCHVPVSGLDWRRRWHWWHRQIAHRLTILFSVRSNIKALLLRLRAGSDSEMVRHTSTGHHSIVLILHFSMRRSKTHVSHCFVCMAREYKFELKPIFYIVIIDGFMRLLLLWAECDNCGGGGGIRPISSSSHCAYFTD